MKKNILAIAIIFLLMVAVGIYLGLKLNKSNNDSYYYTGINGEKFAFQVVKTGNITQHIIRVHIIGTNSDKLIPLDYGPKELEGISLEANINQKVLGTNLAKTFIYITQDPKLPNQTNIDSFLAVQDIAKVTGTAPYSVFQIPTRAAYTYDDNSSEFAEFIDCRYANSKIGVILLKLGNENKIYSENDCVIVEAKNGKDLRKTTDKLIYALLGVF
jgi:uncharacterized protein YpmS